VYFVSDDHLGDLDRHGDLLDVFDVVRLLRHIEWGEPVEASDRLDFNGDGRLSEADARIAADTLLAHAMPPHAGEAHGRVAATATVAVLRLDDGSSLTVPRAWTGKITDLEVTGTSAMALVHTTVPFTSLRKSHAAVDGGACVPVDHVAVNQPYYRQEPHAMRRYLALALDNVRRDPMAYLTSVIYRTLRVFFIEGTDDLHTAQQFTDSGRIYRAAQVVSIALFSLFAVGVWAAWSRGAAIALPLLLIAYIPATLAFVLTNMRYSITVQPLMFLFIAAALVEAAEWRARGRGRVDTRTARRL
jgi:hypothetical protein